MIAAFTNQVSGEPGAAQGVVRAAPDLMRGAGFDGS
jgi:hypothetical protein